MDAHRRRYISLAWVAILLLQTVRAALRPVAMQGSEFFPWLALTGIMLGPYIIYEAKSRFAAVLGWGITATSAVALCYCAWAFWPSGWSPLAWPSPYVVGLAFVALLFVAGFLVLAFRKKPAHPASSDDQTLPHFRDFVSGVRISDDGIHLPLLNFTTGNQTARKIPVNRKIKKLRFVLPREQVVSDPPADIPIGKGRVIIKQFVPDGILLEEQNTYGDTLQAEIYFDEPPVGLRSWQSLSQRQISELRNRFAAIPPIVEGRNFRNIAILRLEFPDCADLADDIAEAFRTAWANPAILPGKPWGDFKEGIWIVGPRDDPRIPILLSILSEVLGAEYEPLGLVPSPPAPIPPLELAAIIRIEIGRKPRK
ncbi:hypothetical protein [Candidatus Binatus sp.]|uniref:hypothetical protein n=1 Tax=Candidatus Binatus sp. TaxID=2811406 RepID=UPI003BB13793